MAGGSASITTSGKKTDIHQSSNKVILDWRSFDIGADEHTEFHQPSKNAIALNRIRDTKASQIDGKLTANGNIMLINPNGVVFGSGAKVDVGSLTATTADIDNDDFMAGKMDFKAAGNTAGAIVNNGSITVKDAGLVNFVAPRVENNGVIVAKLGKVQLAAADTFTLDMAGDGLLQVAVSEEDSQKIAKNSGAIHAEGGYVAVTAAKARGLVDSLVDNTGIIEASSLTTRGGKIILSADGGTTKNSGAVKANGKTGGGEILIGGDYQGVGDTKNSRNTEIAQSAVIEASATDTGDGGKVIVWADGNTSYAGSIKAQGGVNGGNGGFVETSGKANLHVAEGSGVTASARHEDGEAGTWLLDPSNVTITNGSGNSIPAGGGTINPATDSYTIDAASITTALNGGNNVIVTTTNGAGTEQGDITVTGATISKTAVNNSVTLTLRAARNITVENSTISSTSDSLGVVLNADRDANSTGAIRVTNSTLDLNGGSFIAGGGTAPTTTAAVATQDGVFDVGVLIDNSNIRTNGAGNITINGRGESTGNNNYGILITNNSLLRTSTTGSTGVITLNGTGGAGGTNNHGIYITAGGRVRSDRGATIAGTGGSNGTIGSTHNVGILVDGGGFIEARGIGSAMGSVTLTGVGGAGYGQNHGVEIDGNTTRLTVNDGDLIVNATSGYNGALGASPGTNYGFVMSTDSDVESISTTAGEAGNITINSNGEDTVLGGDGITSSVGNITINADSLTMTHDALSSTSGNITIAPFTATRSIGLGGGAGLLNLTDAELATISTGGKLILGKSGTGTGDIDLDSWDWSSKLFSAVELYGNDIDIGGMTMGAGPFLAHAIDNGGDAGDLNISANITRAVNGDTTLDLRADRNITNSGGADIVASDANSDADGNPATSPDRLNVILNADRNADNDGAIALTNATVTSLGGYFVAGGGSGAVGGVNGILGDGDGTGADDVAAWGSTGRLNGIIFDNADISTGAGSLILNGHGSNIAGTDGQIGIYLHNGSTLETTGGDLMLTGVGGNGARYNYGIGLAGGTTVTSSTGEIAIKATAGSSGAGGSANNDGMVVEGASVISSTGTGPGAATITIEATGATANGLGSGLYLNSGRILTKDGDIHVTGNTLYYAGIAMANSAAIEADGSGDITLVGTETVGAGSGALYSASGSNSIGGATATGDITLIGDTVEFSALNIRTSGTTLVKGNTASTSIGLGGGSGTLNLSDAELGYFNGTGKLIIGDAATGTGDIDLDSWNMASKSFDVELYGNDIDLGGLTLGAGDFMAYAKDNGGDVGDLTVSAAIARGGAGTSILDLRADRNITFASAANIASTTGAIDVIVNSDYNNVGGGTIAYNATSIDTNGGDIELSDDVTLGADTAWNARGGTFTTGGTLALGVHDLSVTADNAVLGDTITGNAGSILTLKPYDNARSIGLGGGAGGFNLTDAELAGISTGHLVIGDAVSGTGDITIQSWSLSGKSYDIELYGRDIDINGMTMGAGDITMIAANDVTLGNAVGNTGTGGDLYIDVGNDFANNAGVSAISMGAGGRFLVYIDSLTNITRGGMTTGNLFGRDFTNDDPTTISTSFGNRFVFDETPTLTVTADDVTLGYNDPAYNTFTYTVSGLATGDTDSSALSGAPVYSTAQLTPTTYRITPATGTMLSTLGYLVSFQNGTLTMPTTGGPPPPAPTPTPPAATPTLPPSVERQIQIPELLFSQGTVPFETKGENTIVHRKDANYRVTTPETDSFTRMIEGGFLRIEQEVIDYYDLFSYNADYEIAE